jgi:DNA-binding LacI/PurR family transcriptional regulator
MLATSREATTEAISEVTAAGLQAPSPHKRQQIADGLREMVLALSPGDRLPSLSELERHFQVAKSTVQLAVADLREEGLIYRRQGSGTFVAERREAGPAGGLTGKIASPRAQAGFLAVMRTHGNPNNIFQTIVESIEEEARQQGQAIVLTLEPDMGRNLNRATELWRDGKIDGFIHVGSTNWEQFSELPGVIIGEVPESAGAHQVVVDNFGAGVRAAEYLTSLGHRRLAYLATPGFLPGGLRAKGFTEGAARVGATVTTAVATWPGVAPWQDREHLKQLLGGLLQGDAPPTAFFACHDSLAIALLNAFAAMGVKVPEEVSVIGFDDLPLIASHHYPPLTTVRMPCSSLARLAFQTLNEAIQFPALPKRRLQLPGEIVVRESAGPCPSRLAFP